MNQEQQPSLPPQQENLPAAQPSGPQKGAKTLGLIGGVLVLLIAGGALAYWQYQKQQAQNKPSQNSQNGPVAVTDNQSGTPVGGPPPTDNNSPITTTTPAAYSLDAYENQQCKNRLAPVVSKSGIVEWVEPKKISSLHIFPEVSNTNQGGYSDINYIVGHVKSGKYAGGEFIVSQVTPDGPSVGERFRIISKDGKYYYLSKYSDSLPDSQWGVKLAVSFIQDNDFDLPDLNFPEKLHADNPAADFAYSKSLGFFQNGVDFFCADHLVKVFSDPNTGDVFTDAVIKPIDPGLISSYYPKFGFYVKGPDASMRTYQLLIPIIDEKNIPLVTWNDGKKNIEEYFYQGIGGCGVSNFRDVADVKEGDLTQIGIAFDGQAVYGYKDSNAQGLKDMYDQTYFPEGQSKPSYNVFLASRPMFFWRDFLGKFIRFQNKKYQPMGECGKPVIYLYPEKTEKISVSLNPLGGFSYTEPAYNDGWNVIADPQSNITDIADGKIYPYLFWEGRGGMYKTPDRGFVIDRDHVHQFLADKLGQLGLNDKESADFMEFWEPKMQSASYYFVTFMGNSVMDRLAPLSITPKPDTVIRILMDFTPLKQPISAEGYNIRTPERKGFTVVEWGGVLRNDPFGFAQGRQN